MSLFTTAKHATNLTDETIATQALGAAHAAANAYLNAALTSSTPELRAMYSAGLTEIVGEHTILADLAIRKNWVRPYDTPSQQLSEVYDKSRSVMDVRM